jgi:3-deoxy-D-manno-octulosonic acid (KDO) 8-phosphate synthase
MTRGFDVGSTKALHSGTIPLFEWNHWRVEKHSSHLENSAIKNAEILKQARDKFPKLGAVVCTPQEISIAAPYSDYLYIPGEFSRQADVLDAAKVTGKVILLERGPFLTPPDTLLALEKLSPAPTIVVDGGYFFGYSSRILDPRSLWLFKQQKGVETGIQLSDLLAPQGPHSSWSPSWTSEKHFAMPLLLAARALGISSLVYRDFESGALTEADVLKLMNETEDK